METKTKPKRTELYTKISVATADGPRDVAAIVFGVWGVHRDVGPARTPRWIPHSVSHIPSGRCVSCMLPSRIAILLADFLHAEFTAWGADATHDREPSEDEQRALAEALRRFNLSRGAS